MRHFFLILFLAMNSVVMAQTVTPEVNGSIYSLNFSNIELKVDAASGAKVSSFIINGLEFFITSIQSPGYLWGSSLWPAPQTEMGWPPPMDLDDGSYTPNINGNVMTFTSPVDVDNLGNDLQFIKSYWVDETDTSISIRYSLVNKGTGQITKALWELTRVPVNGLSFWPTGPGGTWDELASSTIDQNGHTWMDIDAESIRNDKLMADGSKGWFAHVDNYNRLFIKAFENVSEADFADGEGEIELYISDAYVELENLSAALILNANDTLHYDVKWYLRQLPAHISVETGSIELANYANFLVYGEGASINSIDQSNTHSVYPNPTSNYVQFNLASDNYETISLNLYDMMGKLYFSNTIENGQQIDISELESGVYLYSIFYNERIEKGRIVKY